MARVLCPDCGKKISDQAEVCPRCGRPLDDRARSHAKASRTIMGLGYCAIAVGIVLAVATNAGGWGWFVAGLGFAIAVIGRYR